MMWLLLAPTASAQTPVEPLDRGSSVTEVVWARPFTLAQPEPWRFTAEAGATLTEGWLVELRADPALLRPSQTADPVLYAGEAPVMRFNWDHVGGCAVVVVPGRPDLASTEFYFGSLELPGRVDAERARAEREAAKAVGVRPLPVDAAMAAGGAVLAASDLREVHTLAMERVAACTATPSDLQRAGVPSPVDAGQTF